MRPVPAATRRLLKAAMVLFVITIVIGILNGTDLWDVPRDTLLTHVHAGTLGWITLGVFAAAIWMFDTGDARSANRLSVAAIVSVTLYVLAFWSVGITTTSIQRPIGGTLAFLVMVWMLVWVVRQKRIRTWDVAELGMGLALTFLVFGAVLGVLLGLQLADVEIVEPAKGGQLYDSHPGAMVAGFVLLAALAMIEWLMPGRQVPTISQSRMGAVQMLLLFVAGILFVVGFLFAVDALQQAAGALQLLGTIVLIVRFRKDMLPSRWGGPTINRFVRTAVVGLVIAVGLILYLIAELSSGKTFEDILGVGLAFDHLNFIMVVTNLMLAMLLVAFSAQERRNRLIFWMVNVGVAGFAVGLIAENALLKRIFTPVMGLGLLLAIYTYLTAPAAEVMTSSSS